MDILLLRQFLDCCEEARRLTKWFPTLPKELTLRHMKVINAIYELSESSDFVRVSDVSDAMHSTRPSITKLIQELERHGAVCKRPDGRDKRLVLLTLTEMGKQYHAYYCIRFQNWLREQLDGIPPEEFETTIRTIHQVYEILNTQEKKGWDKPDGKF